MSMSVDEFRRKYPNLAREVLDGQGASLSLRVDVGFSDPWRGYLPGVYDYLRRCKSVQEAEEVLEYLVRHGEISSEDADEIRRIIREKGLEYFGKRKEDDYYYKTARAYWESLKRASK